MLRKRLLWRLYPRMLGLLLAAVATAGLMFHLVEHAGLRLLAGGAIAAFFALAANYLQARYVVPALRHFRAASERFAQGELTQKLPAPDSAELAEVAESLNAMAEQIDRRIASLLGRTREQEAVLASMAEGVLAVDTEERVISLNSAAARLLGTGQQELSGRNLQEVVRNVELLRFVASTLRSKQPVEGDVVLHNAHERVLQANGTALRDPAGRGIGAVVVLNDVSRLRQLESMRRDFAANVSHELKTPITSIKGFVETLLDGAMRDAQDAERFLRIIARQADRLNAIIEDLLSLSRIEREAEASDIVLTAGDLREVLESAMYDCESAAGQRQVRIVLDCQPGLEARMNPPLLEQAVGNLLDNAIKYSEPGREVHLSAQKDSSALTIQVRDQGCGIAEEHLARLFERFYRVDKARSRKLGGTGLGLAIVKHIVLAHRGRVSVESTPGQGSTFSIHLPQVA